MKHPRGTPRGCCDWLPFVDETINGHRMSQLAVAVIVIASQVAAEKTQTGSARHQNYFEIRLVEASVPFFSTNTPIK